jgi:hypothetical protein
MKQLLTGQIGSHPVRQCSGGVLGGLEA